MRHLPRFPLTLTRPRPAISRTFITIAALLTTTGCASKQQGTKGTLNQGYGALTDNHLDQAQAAADKVLADGPTGKGAADALYLRGRVFEERARTAEGNPSQVMAQL